MSEKSSHMPVEKMPAEKGLVEKVPEKKELSREELMEEIQATGFTLIELNLYLDTHPDDQQALGDYNSLAHHYQYLRYEYQKQFGPLEPYGHAFSAYPWQWKESPWPWQM